MLVQELLQIAQLAHQATNTMATLATPVAHQKHIMMHRQIHARIVTLTVQVVQVQATLLAKVAFRLSTYIRRRVISRVR